MKNATIRLVFLLALLCTVGIISTQVFWVKKAYSLEEKEFDLVAHTALRNVATRIWELKDIQPLVYQIVSRIDPKYFIVQINTNVDAELLGHLLKEEFEQNKIITDYEFALYDCMNEEMVGRQYIQMGGREEKYEPMLHFPVVQRENYYFAVYFPHRTAFVSKQLSLWFYSSLGLLCVILFLGYVVFIILKQKRFSEIQKDFINNMAHEFKTPLTSIQLAAEVLKKPEIVERPQRLLSYATIIDNEAAQLVLQIERVLQTVHSDKGFVQIRRERLVLQDLIREIVASFESKVKNKDGTVTLRLPKEPVLFLGDKLHLRNLISNLLDNALKYSEQQPTIELSLEEQRNKIKLAIKDNGIGIAPEHQKNIFKKFFRVPTGNLHNVKGFGLGLNYVELIARLHGGTVFCASELGCGSTFTVVFSKEP